MANKLFYFTFVLFILFFSFASSKGCCVSSSLNTCSANTDRDPCQNVGGTFYATDSTCSTIRTCDNGCCILGLYSSRMTRGKCQTETETAGFSAINFMQTSEDCTRFITSQEWGACIALDSYGKKVCRFSTRNQCAGEFFSDILCTNINNSNCNKTTKQVCVGNKIYFTDSCRNRDSFVKECDYNSGFVCKQIGEVGDSSAECVDASCRDDFNYSAFVVKELYQAIPIFNIVTRNQGSTWCVTNGMVPFSDNELERNLSSFGSSISGAAGLRFFSRYCSNGQIITEACEDGKEGYCSGESNSSGQGVSVGTGGKCVSNEWRECISAENEDDCDKSNCFWFAAEKMVNNTDPEVVKALEISKCLPKVSAGIVDSSSTSCSQGDFTGEFKDGIAYVSNPTKKFVLLNPEIIALLETRCSRIADCTGKMSWVGVYGRNSSSGVEYMNASEINSQIASRGISFVSGKNSGAELQQLLSIYLSKPTGIENYSIDGYPKDKFPVIFNDKGTTDDDFEYKCVARKAPLNGNCSICNKEGSICSEYACEAIGKNCEYLPSGTCENKGDITSPNITVNCPASGTIGIQQSVRISVITSETTQCRFNLDSALANYDLMQKDFGTPWGTNHETILSIPGLNELYVGNATQYALLLKSGTYNVFIRCTDPRGNGDTDPAKLCSFNVPKTPDKNSPIVLKFSPVTNSPIIFNTTTKKVDMLVNEPVECKWSLKDQDYDLMNNSFNCSQTLTLSATVSGYNCATTLNNVTKNIGNTTKFYIRCKDQPYLTSSESVSAYLKKEGYSESEIRSVLSGVYSESEIRTLMQNDGFSASEIDSFWNMYSNMETTTYSRNKNTQSTVYSLRPSEKLEITELSPKNQVILGPNFADWNLSVKTSGGGYQGITECKWKLNYKNFSTAFSAFTTTQSTFKTQSIDQKTEGDYVLSVICADDADNTANYSGPLSVRYDKTAPTIARVFNNQGSLKIVTNEPAVCKFTSVLSMGMGCAFTFMHPNLTIMTGASNVEHMTSWKRGSSYFIKCQDFYGNENSLCGVVAKSV